MTGDTVVEESLAIARYLDETYPNAAELIGNEALTQFVIAWTQANFNAAVTKVALMDIYDSLAPADQQHFRTTREKIFGSTLEEFAAKFPKGRQGNCGSVENAGPYAEAAAFHRWRNPAFC